MKLPLKGVFPPVPTPFLNSKPDFKQLNKVLGKLMETKLSGALILGSNGEFASMTQQEQVKKQNLFFRLTF
jgi:4-hydroxy-2-oxoglutarate aldolase